MLSAMKALDRFGQWWRFRKACPYIPEGSRVFDVGCFDGALFRRLRNHIVFGVGIDPDPIENLEGDNYHLIRGHFPQDVPKIGGFDVVTMFATLEHIPDKDLSQVSECCASLLKPGGILIVTVPSPMVDQIVAGLIFLKLADGMSIHQHHGFNPDTTPNIFEGFTLIRHEKFQLGLNNLFVMRRIGGSPS